MDWILWLVKLLLMLGSSFCCRCCRHCLDYSLGSDGCWAGPAVFDRSGPSRWWSLGTGWGAARRSARPHIRGRPLSWAASPDVRRCGKHGGQPCSIDDQRFGMCVELGLHWHRLELLRGRRLQSISQVYTYRYFLMNENMPYNILYI